MANSFNAQFVIRKEPGTQTYHVILPSCGSSGKADCQKVLLYRDRWLFIERKSNKSTYIRLETRALMESQPAFMQSSDTEASGTNQGLIAARSRLAKQGLTIPQLELVALVTWL